MSLRFTHTHTSHLLPRHAMVSIEPSPPSPARISFSNDFLGDKKSIESTISSNVVDHHFEFLSSNSTKHTMLPADELFFEGKLLPAKLNTVTPKIEKKEEETRKESGSGGASTRSVSWYMDEDPSPRPPTCTVLWKELLNLKKHHAHHAASSLSPSSSTSSSSSSSSLGRMESIDEGKEGKEGLWNKEKHVQRIKKGLERTRSASFRIRPMVNVPVCTPAKNTTSLHSMLHHKRVNVDK